MDVGNTLSELRTRRGFSAAQLAAAVGVSRQTIYAMEAGSYVPNTLVALKLAQVLEVKVEALFWLEKKKTQPASTAEVELLPWAPPGWSAAPGQPLHLCSVGNRLIAVPAEAGIWGLPAADALVVEPLPHSSKARVQFIAEDYKSDKRLLLAGPDPSAPVLAHHLQRHGVGLIVAYENGDHALELLKQGLVHVAGVGLTEGAPAMLRKAFSHQPIEVVRYAAWEEGLVVAPGNPKSVRAVADLARPEVTIVNREPGASGRRLLDARLKDAGISSKTIKGYERIARGDLPAARRVLEAEADCCIGSAAAARALGLGFLALATQPYGLIWRKSHTQLPQIEALLEILGQVSFRRELEVLWGYDAQATGERLENRVIE
jgi:molybdate-binding protein/DNA-binding XRE family transcriptional regulator